MKTTATTETTARSSPSRPALSGPPLLAAVLIGALAGCSKTTGSSYGQLACLDGWPSAPPSMAASASLPATPKILWETDLASSAIPQEAGVTLTGDHVVASGGSSWVALDRMTGTRLFGGTGDPANYLLGAPAVGADGAIYVQSNVLLYAFEPDGRPRWTWPLLGQAESAEPVQGLFAPTILGDKDILVSSPGHQTAVDNTPTQLWTSTTYGASQTGGHWGVGDDGSSTYVLDLRTGQTAGRLRTQGGHDVIPVIAPLNGGILTMDRDNATALHLVMFDHCGRQQWTVDIPGTKVCPGIGLVGLDEVLFLSIGSCAGGQPSPEIIAIDAAGKMKGTPIATKQAPWAVGADGTLYAIDMGLVSPPSTLTALSPGLVQEWTLSIPGTVEVKAGAVLADDGVLYAQIEGTNGNAVIAVQATSPGLAPSSWPLSRHDNRRTNWGGGTF